MGEIADMMLEGILDEWTGEYIGEAVGYPRSADPDHPCNCDGSNDAPIQRQSKNRNGAKQRRKRRQRAAQRVAGETP